jgi:ribosomal-protein-alanine N-acetyltransferase
MTRLQCNRCLIRDWARSDRDSLVRYANNRDVWRNLAERFPHPYTEADADAWFATLDGMAERTHWAIEVGGEAVGGIGVDLGKDIYAKTAHFGYWLGEPFWRRGIMTEAVKAASAHAMSYFDLVRLEAPVFESNPASMRVLEKAGFVREAVLHRAVYKDGRILDTVLYALVG